MGTRSSPDWISESAAATIRQVDIQGSDVRPIHVEPEGQALAVGVARDGRTRQCRSVVFFTRR